MRCRSPRLTWFSADATQRMSRGICEQLAAKQVARSPRLRRARPCTATSLFPMARIRDLIPLPRARYSVTYNSDLGTAAKTLDGFKGKAVVLSDLNVQKQSALVFLGESLRKYPQIPFTLLARSPSLESVIEALKQGAYDFLRKPGAPDILCHSVARSLEKLNLPLEGERKEKETHQLFEKSRAALEKARKISEFKGFLISTTGHDFNSALTVLDGYHQFIREQCKDCREPGASNLFEQAKRSITRLRAMSSMLLDYEAAERGGLCLHLREFVLTPFST